MSVRYTAHAERQMLERGIEAEWVERVVLQPDWTRPDPDPSLTRSFKAIHERDGRFLRVVHRPAMQDTLVVTAHFDRGAHL